MNYISKNQYTTITTFITIIFLYQCKSQEFNLSTDPKQLNSLLQNYAYKSFNHQHHPLTGKIYEATPPSNLTGIKISIIRLKSGSLLNRGFKTFKEFDIPTGVTIQPYAMRLAFVYHNLGNWSSHYYPLHGYTYLSPIIGLLAYNAANLSAMNLNEPDVIASKSPILIKFQDVMTFDSVYSRKCVWFDLDGLHEFRELEADNVCSTYRQGHFSIVVNNTELLAISPSPSLNVGKSYMKFRVWIVVLVVLSGFMGLVVLVLVLICLCGYRKKMQVKEMERRAEHGEPLQMVRVGLAQAPVALSTRTQPILEDEFMG